MGFHSTVVLYRTIVLFTSSFRVPGHVSLQCQEQRNPAKRLNAIVLCLSLEWNDEPPQDPNSFRLRPLVRSMNNQFCFHAGMKFADIGEIAFLLGF